MPIVWAEWVMHICARTSGQTGQGGSSQCSPTASCASPRRTPGCFSPSSLHAAFPSPCEPRYPNLPAAAQNLSHHLSVIGIFSAPAAKVASQRWGADSQRPERAIGFPLTFAVPEAARRRLSLAVTQCKAGFFLEKARL